jgi:hypothetical protein
MRFEPLEAKDKTGQAIVLRNAEESDAEDIIIYLKITTGETPFLIREPDEVKLREWHSWGHISAPSPKITI